MIVALRSLGGEEDANQFVLGVEAVGYLRQVVEKDGLLMRELVRYLAQSGSEVSRDGIAKDFAEIVARAVAAVREAGVSPPEQRTAREFQAMIEATTLKAQQVASAGGSRKGTSGPGVIEHRLSPRLEWLTDFGYLEKSRERKNAFSYTVAPALSQLLVDLDEHIGQSNAADEIASRSGVRTIVEAVSRPPRHSVTRGRNPERLFADETQDRTLAFPRSDAGLGTANGGCANLLTSHHRVDRVRASDRGCDLGRRSLYASAGKHHDPAAHDRASGVTATKRASITVNALRIEQRSDVPLFVFGVNGRLIHQFAAVDQVRRDDDGVLQGYQRERVKRHIGEIEAYLKTVDAILPNAIVVAFTEVVDFVPLSNVLRTEWGTPGRLKVRLPDTRRGEAGLYRRRSATGHGAGGTRPVAAVPGRGSGLPVPVGDRQS